MMLEKVEAVRADICGAEKARMQIEELLLEYSPTILFVEHDSEFCQNVATKIVEL